MVASPSFSKKQLRKAGRFLRDLDNDALATSDDFWSAVTIIDAWRAHHARPLARTNAGLRYYVRKAGASPPEVTQRLKRFSSIVQKLRREPTMQLDTMEDIGGVRAVLPWQEQIDQVVAELRRQPRWKIRRCREYISGRRPGPKPDGYRAVHVVVERDGCYIEIQLRTPWQDAWAQSVEQDTRRLRAGLKFGGGPADLREYYRVAADYLELRALDRAAPEELVEELSKLHHATRGYYADLEPGAPN